MNNDGKKKEMADIEEEGSEEGRHAAPLSEENGQEYQGEMLGTVMVDRVLGYFMKNAPAVTVGVKPQSPWLTIRQAEEYARVPHGVISEAIKDGELPAYQRREGTTTVVDMRDVDEWIRTVWISFTKSKGGRDGGLR